MELRARVDHDPNPTNDYLEQWDTPEKYYGKVPECPKCECPMDYEKGHAWLCDECGRDDDVTRLEWDGSGSKTGGMLLVDGKPVPFDEYKQTYGDPDRYIYLFCVVEAKCECCGHWDDAPGMTRLYGVDFYEYGEDPWDTGTFTLQEVDDMANGHLRDTLKDLVSEVCEPEKDSGKSKNT